jgi:PadR family transcriptional regulator, regulatory protein PadR
VFNNRSEWISAQPLPIDVLYQSAPSDIECQQELFLPKQIELLQGTLDLLILKAVNLEPAHGLSIVRRIERVTGTFQLKPGSLFPTLHRMEKRGWLTSAGVNRKTAAARNIYELEHHML